MAEFDSAEPPSMETLTIDPNRAAPTQVPGWNEAEVFDYSAMGGDSGVRTFGGSARVYDWNDEFGDIGPKVPELEKELFGEPGEDSGAGLDFSRSAPKPYLLFWKSSL